ncbi:hypothetical protein [Nocardioides humi]|uniref:Lipoprotein LpqN n=1 Tax=Nocardioides humi TaxID=449461 RepID=A0ABN2B2P3_9ACTN|nr:hypothetical protein [Nocardioides humi]
MVSRRRTLPAAALLLLPLALAACDDASPEPADGSGTPSAGSTEPSTAESGTAEPTASEPPAADGQLVEGKVLSYHLPGGVEWRTNVKDFTIASHRDGTRSWSIVGDEVTMHAGSPDTLDAVADLAGVGDRADNVPPLARVEDRVVQGVTGFMAETETRIRYGSKFHLLVLTWGTSYDGQYVILEMEGPPDDPRTREWFDAVLASITWK